jgi:Sel1 repeat-containing protein/HEAT repeat protein
MKPSVLNRSFRRLAFLAAGAAIFGIRVYAADSELKDDSGKTIIRYVVEPPPGIAPAGATDPEKQVGLFLCFPEHDTPTDADIFPVRQTLWRLGLRDGYVLLAGGPQAQKFGMADMEPIEKLIAWAKKTYPINPRRIYMFGKGEGGKISAEFTMTHPNIVTAAITHSWGFWVMPSELTQPIDMLNSAPEIYMNLGLRDLATHLTTVRDTYPRVKAKGYHVIYREFEDMGSRSYYPPSNDDSISWATRLRNKNIEPSPAERDLLSRYNGDAGRLIVNGYFPGLALVGGAPAGVVLQKLFQSPDEQIRTAAAGTGSHGLFGEATVEKLALLIADPSPAVRQAAIRALGINANWRSQAAQEALIKLATDQGAGLNERLSATDALGYAVRLQVRGVRQDPPMFRALVSLLTDKNEPVRASASVILMPVYQPGSATPPLKAPEGGWQTWLEAITVKEAGYLKDYEVCGWGKPPAETVYPGNRGSSEPEDLFCQGGDALLGKNLATGQATKRDPHAAFEYTMQAAEKGYVPAEAALGMLYANGQGVEQNYAESRKWFVKAAEGGHRLAAESAANGRGAPRPPATPAK